MKNAPIIIFIAAVIIIGLAVKPGKSSLNKQTDEKNPDSSIGKSAPVPPAGRREMGESLKDIEKEIEEARESARENGASKSPYYGKVEMSKISGLRQSDPNREYISLSARLDDNEEVKITDWYLKSEVTGYSAVIGKAALLPFPYTRTETDVMLLDDDRVILTKGFSPIGISFRTNKCTGYFEEDRTFYPPLPRQCPLPEDENLPRFSTIPERNEECLDLIGDIPRCTTRGSSYIRDLPDTVTESCKAYIRTQINYNSCVANHFGDTDFPGREYRVFFNKFGPLWRTTHDRINLHDNFGLIVDTIEY